MVTMSADIDIDVPDRQRVLDLIEHVPAMQITNQQVRRHNSGIYVTPIPRDPITGMCAIDYAAAETRGYFKIDVLNMSVYQLIRDQAHYDQLMQASTPWDRLWLEPGWCQQVVHIGNYGDLLNDMRPDTVPRMAAFLSVIRPGKAHLQRRPWEEIFRSVWDGDTSQGYHFKKSHAIGYAHLVALHIKLLCE